MSYNKKSPSVRYYTTTLSQWTSSRSTNLTILHEFAMISSSEYSSRILSTLLKYISFRMTSATPCSFLRHDVIHRIAYLKCCLNYLLPAPLPLPPSLGSFYSFSKSQRSLTAPNLKTVTRFQSFIRSGSRILKIILIFQSNVSSSIAIVFLLDLKLLSIYMTVGMASELCWCAMKSSLSYQSIPE